jgi:hypothetical protein
MVSAFSFFKSQKNTGLVLEKVLYCHDCWYQLKYQHNWLPWLLSLLILKHVGPTHQLLASVFVLAEEIFTYNIPSALIISGNFFECISKTY